MSHVVRAATILAAGAALLVLVTSCGGSGASAFPQDRETVDLDSADFTSAIDNPWMPLRTGARWVYRVTSPDGGDRKTVVTVLDETREVMGVETRVVHELELADGELVEETDDWYAQDADGNVWYFGEDTRELEDGVVWTTAGSWEAGVDGAQPGILFPAQPEVGMSYRQEFVDGPAEDEEEVIRLDESVQVPYGSFDQVVMTRDVTPDEPELVQYKFFARGVGRLLAVELSGGNSREALVRHTTPR